MSTTTARPRVWLVAGLGASPAPVDRPTVRDDQGRIGTPGAEGRYHTDGRHHASWDELHRRSDLVEVSR